MNYKVMTLIGIIVIVSILSGCVNSHEEAITKPIYYDEKAFYLMNDSLHVIHDDINKFNTSPSLLERHSKNYYDEMNKLIVSPVMQPAVDEFKQSMAEYYNIATSYETSSRTCQIPKYKELVEIYNQCVKDQSELNNRTTQEIYSAINMQINSINLLPEKKNT
ncbi:MAG: hypothetical protein O8C61_04670 [Candidatus Methanoperedens sp.]|nr:hypothetical protein [Candidatus Methanoperedens sp.]